MQQTIASTRLRQLKGFLGENGILLFLVASLLACAVFVPNFVSAFNLRDLALQATDLLIISCGLTFVVLNGGIDFSVTSTLALGSVTGAYIMALSPIKDQPALSIPCAIVAMVAIGGLVGALNGVAVSVLKMPSFIATLGTQLTFSGLAIFFARKVSPRSSINGLPDPFMFLGGRVRSSSCRSPSRCSSCSSPTGSSPAPSLAAGSSRWGRTLAPPSSRACRCGGRCSCSAC